MAHKIMFLTLAMLISLTHSLECTKQNLTSNKLYSKCVDLPYLKAYLHWTYDQTKSSLSIAFIAPPAKSDGWIAWAINPTKTGMVGSQSLVAFKLPNGSMTVQTFNISSYGPIEKSKILYNVSGMKAEHVGDVITLYATLALPPKMTTVDQVWQVGGAVTGEVPQKHEFGAANLNAMGTLDLTKGSMNSGISKAPATSPVNSPDTIHAKSPAPVISKAPSTETTKAPAPNTVSMIRSNSLSCIVLLLIASLL